MSLCAKQCFICGQPEGNFTCLEQGCKTGRDNLARKEYGQLQDLLSGKTPELAKLKTDHDELLEALKEAADNIDSLTYNFNAGKLHEAGDKYRALIAKMESKETLKEINSRVNEKVLLPDNTDEWLEFNAALEEMCGEVMSNLIKEGREKLEGVSIAPWRTDDSCGIHSLIDELFDVVYVPPGEQDGLNAELIVWSRNNMGALLDEIETLRYAGKENAARLEFEKKEQQKQINILRATNKLLDEMVSEKGIDLLKKQSDYFESSHLMTLNEMNGLHDKIANLEKELINYKRYAERMENASKEPEF